MKRLTMIVRHSVNKNIIAYTLMTEDYQTIKMSVKDISDAINGKKAEFTNLEIKDGAVVSSNGDGSHYTTIDEATGAVVGEARAVILDRVEANGKLVGYTVFTQNGTIAEVKVGEAVKACTRKLIANGKIRHTQSGDIVSSISGDYPLREIEIANAPKGEVVIDIMYFAHTLGACEYFGAIISCSSAAEMNKIAERLKKSNASVIDSINGINKEAAKSLVIKRMGANSIYGVFERKEFAGLCTEYGAKVKNNMGSIVVSTLTYSKSGELDEATLTLDASWKPIDKSEANSQKVTDGLKDFSKKIISAYKDVKISK